MSKLEINQGVWYDRMWGGKWAAYPRKGGAVLVWPLDPNTLERVGQGEVIGQEEFERDFCRWRQL